MKTNSSGIAAPRTSRPAYLRVVRDPEPNLRPFEHQTWCTSHDDGALGGDPTGQFCRAESIDLDFGDRGPSDYGFSEATLRLEQFLNLDADEPEKTYPTLIWANLGFKDVEFSIDQAEAVAYSLLALVARSRGENAAYEVLADKARETTVTRPATLHRIGA